MTELFAEPHIVKSPFDENKLCIAYPYTENGKWMHKDDVHINYISKQKIKEAVYLSLNQGKTEDAIKFILKELNLK
jgi:hypothetical protein